MTLKKLSIGPNSGLVNFSVEKTKLMTSSFHSIIILTLFLTVWHCLRQVPKIFWVNFQL